MERFCVGGKLKFSDASAGTTYMIVDLGGNIKKYLKKIVRKRTEIKYQKNEFKNVHVLEIDY